MYRGTLDGLDISDEKGDAIVEEAKRRASSITT
jgi:heme oxygenase